MMQAAAPQDGPASERATPLRHELALGALAAVLATAVAATALIASRRFFLIDDYATQFTPVFREIARLLGQGHFPLLTDRVWNGGALLQEYQYAIFNPVSMLLYVALGHVDDLATAAAVYSLVHIGILAGGAYFLCRVLGCAPRHAFVAAVLAPLSDWIFYWGATNWIPALVSMAWLVWAWGFLVLTFRRPGFAPAAAAAAAVAMTVLSGWPFANLGLVISIFVAAEVFLAAGAPWRLRPAAWVMVSLVAGALLAAPAIVPLALYASHTDRGTGPGAWAADVPALLGVGVPYFITHWRVEPSGIRTVWYPMVYVAWFAPLALANADWRHLWKSHATRLVVGAAGAFAALSMFPAIWQFRYMFRFLPYYQFAVLVLASLALSRADEQGRGWSLMAVTAVIAGGVWLAMCQTPPLRHFFIGVGVGLAAAGWIGGRLVGRRDLRWTLFALVAGVVAFEAVLWRTVDGHYPRFPNDWSPPLTSTAPAAGAGPTRYAIFRAFVSDPGPQFWLTFRKDNTALQQPGTSVLGYTPMSSQQYYRVFCAGHLGTECADVVARVTARIPPTDRDVIDLMAVDEVVIQQEKDAQAFRAAAGPGWTEARAAAGAWRFTRIHPVGLAAWTSPGVGAVVISRAPSRIVASARNDAATQGTLVLARAWYPGWSARLNGRPVTARPLAGVLVSVELPPHSAGRLEVSFWPSGLTAGLVLAAIGALLLALAALFPGLIDAPAARLAEIISRRATSGDKVRSPTASTSL